MKKALLILLKAFSMLLLLGALFLITGFLGHATGRFEKEAAERAEEEQEREAKEKTYKQDQANAIVRNVGYVRDPITKTCFAVELADYPNASRVPTRLIGVVDCDSTEGRTVYTAEVP